MAAPAVVNGSHRRPDLHLVVSFPHSPLFAAASGVEGVEVADTLYQTDEDSIYEQDILRNPNSIKPWLAYAEFKLRHGTTHEQAFVLERACLQLPRSYKLWKMVIGVATLLRGFR
jgi:pre-mRNA-splicing factor SYF1